MNNYCVITTINKPTKAVEKLHERFNGNLVVIGDKKTPTDWNYKGIVPVFESFNHYAPDNHYARKNIGYLLAMNEEPDLIYDTDDDNIPNENWKVRAPGVSAAVSESEGWFNVYDMFSEEIIWPRGFSLRHIHKEISFGYVNIKQSSIQQGLSDGDPDVDAIYRLVSKKGHKFQTGGSIYLQPNTWCPFNSQSTWWFPKAYPLMYLPVYASFRCTDIWRSFIAQRCLWELDEGVTFHSPSEVFQERNEHDLMKDFESEVPGYLNNDKIVEILGGLELKHGDEFVCENLLNCYRELVWENILPDHELESVLSWIKDYENITGIVQQTQEGRLAG